MIARPAGRTSPDARLVMVAACVRSCVEGPVDVDLIARSLGVTARRRLLPRPLDGLTIDKETVAVDRRLTEPRRRFVLAHELAHVLVRRGQCTWVNHAAEERFADGFSRELLVPFAELRRWVGATYSDVCQRYGVDSPVALLQLAAVGQAPPIMRHRNRVLCVRCGDRAPRDGCHCLRFRQRSILPLPEID